MGADVCPKEHTGYGIARAGKCCVGGLYYGRGVLRRFDAVLVSCHVYSTWPWSRAYSHVYLMGHVTYAKIDKLVKDLCEPGAFPEQDTHDLAIKIKEYVAKWLIATRMRKQRAKKDAENGLVIHKREPRLLSLIPSLGRGYK